MNFEDKIKELKIVLPEAKAPVGSYVATKVSGKSIFSSLILSSKFIILPFSFFLISYFYRILFFSQ